MSVEVMAVHPVAGCLADVRRALAGVAEVQPVFMTVSEKEAALVALHRIEAQVAELKCRILACADDVAAEHGARDAAAWLAQATQVEPSAARA